MPLLTSSRANTGTSTPHHHHPQAQAVPSIRLISATPTASGVSSTNSFTYETSLGTIPPVLSLPSSPALLAPKQVPIKDAPRGKKLVPKKSKLSILGSVVGRNSSSSDKENAKDKINKERDVSDAGIRGTEAASLAARGGFEIYVDPTDDPDIGEIVMVKKKKSRAGLDGVRWSGSYGSGSYDKGAGIEPAKVVEVTNMPLKEKEKEKESGSKWWNTIGRGRKDSKEKKENAKISAKNTAQMDNIAESRSKIPDTLKPRKLSLGPGSILGLSLGKNTETASRARFNSLDSGKLLNVNSAPTVDPNGSTRARQASMPLAVHTLTAREEGPARPTPTPTGTISSMNGLLVPPPAHGFIAAPGAANGAQSGSIALRAMRSVKSLARIGGSWGGANDETKGDGGSEELKKSKKGKGVKVEKETKETKSLSRIGGSWGGANDDTKIDGGSEESKKSKKGKGVKEEKKMKKAKSPLKEDKSAKSKLANEPLAEPDAQAASRPQSSSGSSFEAGALTASPGKMPSAAQSQGLPSTEKEKAKHSILSIGLGLPSSIRLPSPATQSQASLGSTTSSIVTASIPSTDNNRLSSESATIHSAVRVRLQSAVSLVPAQEKDNIRPNSGVSSHSGASSLRPVSISSTDTRSSGALSRLSVQSGPSVTASRNSGGSVKWDEQGLASGIERRMREREQKPSNEELEQRRTLRGSRTSSRHSSEGRRRTLISAVFPDVCAEAMDVEEEDSQMDDAQPVYPILTPEEATTHGHDVDEYYYGRDEEDVGNAMMVDDELEQSTTTSTPSTTRSRPVSVGKSRPKGIYEEDEGVLSILDAATNDLAQLINTLDVQATPSGMSTTYTPDVTPCGDEFTARANPIVIPTPESPLMSKRQLTAKPSLPLLHTASIGSLRPYAQSRRYNANANVNLKLAPVSANVVPMDVHVGPIPKSAGGAASTDNNNAALISKQIAPWSTLMKGLSSPVNDKEQGKEIKGSRISKTKKSGLNLSMLFTSATPANTLVPTPSPTSTTFRPGHKRTLTPGPDPEPEPVIQPLRPAASARGLRGRGIVVVSPGASSSLYSSASSRDSVRERERAIEMGRAPSAMTFGHVSNESSGSHPGSAFSPSASSRRESASARSSGGPADDVAQFVSTGAGRKTEGSLSPVFKRIQEYEREHLQHQRQQNGVGKKVTGGSLSLVPSPTTGKMRYAKDSYGSNNRSFDDEAESTVPITREARKVLGMSGTMGGSDVSCYGGQGSYRDASDPDSDVPDELRCILATRRSFEGADKEGYERAGEEDYVNADDRNFKEGDTSIVCLAEKEVPVDQATTTATVPSSTHLHPPALDLPVFRASLIDEDDNHLELDDGEDGGSNAHTYNYSSGASAEDEDNTKKSFDFTGEIKKLYESGGSNRRSFVEQLENAFRTPAKVDLKYNYAPMKVDPPPPVPPIPENLAMEIMMKSEGESSSAGGSSAFAGYDEESQSRLVDIRQPSMIMMDQKTTHVVEEGDKSNFDDMYSASRIVDVKEPSMLLSSEDSMRNSANGNGSKKEGGETKKSPHLEVPPASRTATTRSSGGKLNRKFRFGGSAPASQASGQTAPAQQRQDEPQTLSDIIPTPLHKESPSLSSSFELDGFEDDSVLRSIYAKIINKPAAPPPAVEPSSNQEQRRSVYKGPSRPASALSFEGLGDSFEEVRRGFEFHPERPAFYPFPGSRSRDSTPHQKHASWLSIASVSSYGRVINSGSNDPFDYGMPMPMPSLRERPSSEDVSSISISMNIDDTFAFMDKPRRRVESDASSFYFRPARASGQRRRESTMSVSSQVQAPTSLTGAAPPVSLYNRIFGGQQQQQQQRNRNDSTATASSVAMSYIKRGANRAWSRAHHQHHLRDLSVESVMSDFSGMHLGRPGLGDKMFDMQVDLGPSERIIVSPLDHDDTRESKEHRQAQRSQIGHRSLCDSIIDEECRSFSVEDSLFEKTGRPSSVSSDSVFGDDLLHPVEGRNPLLPNNQFRPLSVLSRNSVHSPMQEDDTMISMLGGGLVRRRSVGSIFEASPCVRVEKRKHSAIVQSNHMYKGDDHYDSPNKARIIEKPSIAPTSSIQFGGERMIKAQHGLLERRSLEDSCLVADGEEHVASFQSVPVFSRPVPALSHSSSSYGGDTPPLSASECSSFSEGGSQSSIDLSHVNVVLSNSTHPMPTIPINHGTRARARGTGHRRRYPKPHTSHVSRSSVYETIEEEMTNPGSPVNSLMSKKSSSTTRQAVFIVDSDTASINSKSDETTWDDERGIIALRKFYALKDEAHVTVTESRRQWLDTPFSLFAVQSFEAPSEPEGMQALLQHSVQTFGPLPSELRPCRRMRTSSRPSPYAQARIAKAIMSPDKTRKSSTPNKSQANKHMQPAVLQQVPMNLNVLTSGAPILDAFKPFPPLVSDVESKGENAYGLEVDARSRVGSSARRNAFGWSKRNNGPATGKKSTDQKENIPAVGNGLNMTPGNLRLNRPRPRGRPTPGGRTPATQSRPIRI